MIYQEDNSKCSIFSFDINANRSRLPLAKNALRKLKTLRHPGVVRVLDTVEVGDASAYTLYQKSAALIGGQARQTNGSILLRSV